MAVRGEYLGMPLGIDDLDGENLAYFRYCAAGRLPPPAGPPLRPAPLPAHHRLPVVEGSGVRLGERRGPGRGALLHARCTTPSSPPSATTSRTSSCWWTSTHRRASPRRARGPPGGGQPGEPRTAELAPPDQVARVGIGTRVRMLMVPVTEGLAIPNWTIDDDAVQPVPWRYPE